MNAKNDEPDKVSTGKDSVATHRLTTLLPTPLARELARASAPSGTDAERMSRRLAFLETVLHFVTALQDAERAALCIKAPRSLDELIDRLDKSTIGLWWEACRSLERDLENSDARFLPSVGRVIEVADEAIRLLTHHRNEIAHSRQIAALPADEARSRLDASKVPFRDLVVALTPLTEIRLGADRHIPHIRTAEVMPQPSHHEFAHARARSAGGAGRLRRDA